MTTGSTSKPPTSSGSVLGTASLLGRATDVIACDECGGTGRIFIFQDESEQCSACDGLGVIEKKRGKCQICGQFANVFMMPPIDYIGSTIWHCLSCEDKAVDRQKQRHERRIVNEVLARFRG